MPSKVKSVNPGPVNPVGSAQFEEVLETLRTTKSGLAIFEDCFKPVLLKADKDAIRRWLKGHLPSEFRRVLEGYLYWSDRFTCTHEFNQETKD